MSARRSPSIDKQGIRRGKCTQCSTCQGYSSDKGLTCGKCRHPPTKHENLDIKASLQVFPFRPHPSTTTQQPYSFISSDVYHIPKVTHSLSSSRSSHSPPPIGTTIHTASLLPTSSPSLSLPSTTVWPQCKATGCTDPVFYCDKMGFFEYCSPQCRDEHYLPEYNRSLDNDIKTNTPQPAMATTQQHKQHHQASIDTSLQSNTSLQFAPTVAVSSSDRLMNNGDSLSHYNMGGSSSSHDTGGLLSHDTGGSLSHDTGGSSLLHNVGGPSQRDTDVEGSSSHDVSTPKEVTIELEATEELKLLLKDDSEESRIIIVGASSSKSLDWFRDRKLHLLDCIVSINGEPFQRAYEVFEYAKTRTKLDMVLDQTSSITTDNLLFDKLKEHKVNKVVCIKSNGGQIGFVTSRNKTVKEVSVGSEAEKAGVKRDDKVRAYAAVNKNGQCEDIYKLHSSSLTSDLETAFKRYSYVMLGLLSK